MTTPRLTSLGRHSHESVAVTLALVALGPFPHDPIAAGDPDLTVQIQQLTTNPVLTGAHPIIYRVTVRNLEDASAPAVATVVTFPNTFTFETPAASGSGFSCGNPGTAGAGLVSVSCTTSQMGANAQKQFTVQAKAPAAILGNQQAFTITAAVDPNDTVDEEHEGNNAATVATTVEAASRDLTVRIQQDNQGDVVTGRVQPITYRVTVSNLGDDPVPAVTTVVTFPRSFTFETPAGSGSGVICLQPLAPIARVEQVDVRCTAAAGVGANAQREFTVKAKAPAIIIGDQQVFTITSAVDPSDAVDENNEGNNMSTVATTVRTLAELTPRWTGPLQARVGMTLFYTAHVQNTGDRDATTVSVDIQLPTQVDFVRFDQGTLQCTPPSTPTAGQGSRTTCTGSVIPGGGTMARVIVVRPLTLLGDGTVLLFSMRVDPQNTVPERNEGNNLVSLATTVSSPADLEVTGTAQRQDGGDCFPGSACRPLNGSILVSLRLRVHNSGPGQAAATTVRVNWPRPAFRDVDSQCPAGSHVDQAANQCIPGTVTRCFESCFVPNLLPNAAQEILAQAIVDRRQGGTIFLIPVVVDPNGTVSETDETNNGLTLTIQ